MGAMGKPAMESNSAHFKCQSVRSATACRFCLTIRQAKKYVACGIETARGTATK